jgi:hypothetical protein
MHDKDYYKNKYYYLPIIHEVIRAFGYELDSEKGASGIFKHKSQPSIIPSSIREGTSAVSAPFGSPMTKNTVDSHFVEKIKRIGKTEKDFYFEYTNQERKLLKKGKQ